MTYNSVCRPASSLSQVCQLQCKHFSFLQCKKALVKSIAILVFKQNFQLCLEVSGSKQSGFIWPRSMMEIVFTSLQGLGAFCKAKSQQLEVFWLCLPETQVYSAQCTIQSLNIFILEGMFQIGKIQRNSKCQGRQNSEKSVYLCFLSGFLLLKLLCCFPLSSTA